MEKIVLTFTALLFLCTPGAMGLDSSAYRARLVYGLLRSYNPDVIPDTFVTVKSSLTLVNLLNVDTEANLVELVIWHMVQWSDRFLTWNPEDFGNITSIRLPVDTLWRPDLHIYNSVSPVQILSPLIAVVSYDGSVLIVPSERIQFSCDLRDVARAAGAECHIKIGSWTYDGFHLDLEDTPTFSTDMQVNHTQYDVLKTNAKKNVVHYSCCPEPYEDVTYFLTIRKKNYGLWF